MPLLYGSPQLDYNQRSSYTQEWKTRDAYRTRALYRQMDNHFIRTPHYYRQFALSLGKESPYIFSPFNLLNTDTFCGPPVSILTGFDRSRECFPAILTPPTFCKIWVETKNLTSSSTVTPATAAQWRRSLVTVVNSHPFPMIGQCWYEQGTRVWFIVASKLLETVECEDLTEQPRL